MLEVQNDKTNRLGVCKCRKVERDGKQWTGKNREVKKGGRSRIENQEQGKSTRNELEKIG